MLKLRTDRRSVRADRRSAHADKRSVRVDKRSTRADKRSARADRGSVRADGRSCFLLAKAQWHNGKISVVYVFRQVCFVRNGAKGAMVEYNHTPVNKMVGDCKITNHFKYFIASSYEL